MHIYSGFCGLNVWVINASSWLHYGTVRTNHHIMHTTKIVTASAKKNLEFSLMSNGPEGRIV